MRVRFPDDYVQDSAFYQPRTGGCVSMRRFPVQMSDNHEPEIRVPVRENDFPARETGFPVQIPGKFVRGSGFPVRENDSYARGNDRNRCDYQPIHPEFSGADGILILLDKRRRRGQRRARERNQFKTLIMLRVIKLFGSLIVVVAITSVILFLYWYLMAYDPYRTTLRTKAGQLHAGLTVQETTNLFKEFEVLWTTNYTPSERVISYRFYMERDHVQQWFSTNSIASRIAYSGPERGLMFPDDCEIRFDTNGIIIGYEWEQIH